MATPVAGLRSLACLILGLGFLARVLAFDNTRKDNVRLEYNGKFQLLILLAYSWLCKCIVGLIGIPHRCQNMLNYPHTQPPSHVNFRLSQAEPSHREPILLRLRGHHSQGW